MPSGDNGGVIQFECTPLASTAPAAASAEGSSSGSVEFARTRCLNKPPVVLLTALTSLQAEHGLSDSKINELLARAAKRYPKLQTKLMPPPPTADHLYQAHYRHAGARGAPCDGCCDERMMEPWRDSNSGGDQGRSLLDSGPAIHYGLIASGEQEYECGIVRDRAKQTLHGVLCF
jgi:hypothetical protein